jgi:predicted KAP-like P-loop ATPase
LAKTPSKDDPDHTGDQPPLAAGPGDPERVADAPPTGMSILPAGLTDAPAEKGSLGFAYYVKAIKEFLVSPYTKAPLTLSIEGPWGSGKSSFMMQLRNNIAPEMEGSPSRNQKRTRAPGSPPIVEFNPWRHDSKKLFGPRSHFLL